MSILRIKRTNILEMKQQQLVSLGISLLFSSASIASFTSSSTSQADYIQKWSEVAINNMKTYKIPASITLAQGSLESGNGNSPLAVEGNNHFGIKCSNWDGAKIYFDDDKKGECFRKYSSAADSYRDHSLFLSGKERYASLFDLNIRDYKAWAKGLKKAGYATDPQYAYRLIEIIEKNKLYEFDYQVDTPEDELKGTEMLVNEVNQESENSTVKHSSRKKTTAHAATSESRTLNSLKIDVAYLNTAPHQKKEHENKVSYIVARKGDTYYKIAKEYDMAMWQLYRYNDFEAKKDLLEEGDIVYLEPKRNKSREKNAVYVAKSTMQLCQISQQEGIKLKKIMKLNMNLSEQQAVQKGQKVLLR